LGKSHACEGVLTTLFGIAWHFGLHSDAFSPKLNRFQSIGFLSIRQSCAATRSPTAHAHDAAALPSARGADPVAESDFAEVATGLDLTRD